MTALLCGCQSLALPGWSFKTQRPAAIPRQAAPDYPAILADGKAQLAQNNLSVAAASLRIASSDPSTAADAYNALAVLYAKLGRNDLADRYFRTALALEPNNQRYASNLLRLQRQVLLAREVIAPSQPTGPELASDARSAARSSERGHADTPTFERLSRGVVHIRTPLELGGAPAIRIASRETAVPSKPQQSALAEAPNDEVELAVAFDKSRTYPVRVVLGR